MYNHMSAGRNHILTPSSFQKCSDYKSNQNYGVGASFTENLKSCITHTKGNSKALKISQLLLHCPKYFYNPAP